MRLNALPVTGWMPVALAAVLASFTTTSQAAETSTTAVPQFLVVTPVYINSDSDRGTGDGQAVRAIYGYSLTPHVYWESDVFGSVLETAGNSVTDFYQRGAATGLSWSLYERSHDQWTPYVVGTLGMNYNDVQPDSKDGTSANFAVGLGATSRSLFDNGLKLRAEARYMYDTFEDGYSDLHWSLGLEIPLGEVRTVEKVVYVDRTVEVPVQVEKVVQKVVKVQEPDSDGDSVPDSRDNCPGTLPGAKVDAHGCIIDAQTITFNTISFETGSARLTYSSRQALKPVAKSFSNQHDLKIEIAGHTDSQGPAQANMALSQKRAEAVRAFLIEQGVDGSRLTAKGYGETEPVAENDTAAGRAMNRRVEFRLLK